MRFLRSLYAQVLIAILLGGVLGHVRPDFGVAMKRMASPNRQASNDNGGDRGLGFRILP